MPRSRGGSAPRRPAPAPARPAAPPQQPPARQSSTMAHPPQQQAPAAPQQGSQGSGLFGQMASTAAGVAVGSSIGHAIGGFFGGGSSSQAPAEQQQAQAPASYDNNAGQYAYTQETPSACENQVRSFRTCMDEQQGNMSVCGWYLDQLKACQAQARQY